MKKEKFWFFIVFLFFLGSYFLFINQKNTQNSEERFKTAIIKDAKIEIQIADTVEERIKGLSGREELGKNQGLLFFFENEDYHGIWMKDMNFAIDIAWLDKNKKIIYIEKNILPETYPKVFYPPSPALYVLETSSGFFDSQKINIGDTLEIKEN